MKKSLFYFVLFVLCSCTDMNIKVQRIETPTDCVSNDRWSWNNGIATHSSNIYGQFEFDSKLSGILSFKYAFLHNGREYHDLYVDVNDMRCFYEENYSTDVPTDTIRVIIKNIRKNSRIKIWGRNCIIKNLIISSSLEENKQDEDTPPNDWF